jgi:DNA-binding NarL/FixJ family response regulator
LPFFVYLPDRKHYSMRHFRLHHPIILAVLVISGTLCSCSGRSHSSPEPLKQLDEVLNLKKTYDSYLLQRVSVLRQVLGKSQDPLQIYETNKQIAEEFSSYSMDSTLYYLQKNQVLAAKMNDRLRKVQTDLRLVKEYAMAGYHIDGADILAKYSLETVPEELKYDFFDASHVLYGEMMAYSNNNDIYTANKSNRDTYRDSLLAIVPKNTYDWYNLKREEADESQNDSLSMEYASKMLALTSENSHEFAEAAFFYQFYLKNTDEKIAWLAKSAISDVMCATKDYASLNSLCNVLFEKGDIDRAFRYAADNCMPDAIFFNGKLRPWQVAKFFPEIEKAYSLKAAHQHKMLLVMITVIAFFLAMMVILLIFIRRRQMDLVLINRKLTALNSELQESNKVKQEYIALFLSILSDNINTSRQYKNHVLKYLRRGNDKYLVDEIEALPPIDEDIDEFYKMFDKTFLNLYPDFVEQFNALLSPGEAITPKENDILTPELRIFALIKLGITDSSKIASLLHYSANTIYNYRAKIKNKALGDRDQFEEAVKSI